MPYISGCYNNNQLQLLNQKLDQTKQKMAIARKEQERLGGLLANRGARFNADGTLASGKPCLLCRRMLRNAMLEEVVYLEKDSSVVKVAPEEIK